MNAFLILAELLGITLGPVAAVSRRSFPVCGKRKESRASGCCVQETQGSSGSVYHVSSQFASNER